MKVLLGLLVLLEACSAEPSSQMPSGKWANGNRSEVMEFLCDGTALSNIALIPSGRWTRIDANHFSLIFPVSGAQVAFSGCIDGATMTLTSLTNGMEVLHPLTSDGSEITKVENITVWQNLGLQSKHKLVCAETEQNVGSQTARNRPELPSAQNKVDTVDDYISGPSCIRVSSKEGILNKNYNLLSIENSSVKWNEKPVSPEQVMAYISQTMALAPPKPVLYVMGLETAKPDIAQKLKDRMAMSGICDAR